jgi:small neutral amino acid transporter SnatA (MarC family)
MSVHCPCHLKDPRDVNCVLWPDWLLYVPGTFVALFPIANLFGATSIFYALTANSEGAARRRQARWTAIYVVLILAVTLVAGELVLTFFGISLNVVRIAGEPITRAFGQTGMGALTRVLGFLLLALAVQLVAEGVLGLVREALPSF